MKEDQTSIGWVTMNLGIPGGHEIGVSAKLAAQVEGLGG